MSDNKVFCSGCKHLYRPSAICRFGEIKISPIDGPYRYPVCAKEKNKFFDCKDFEPSNTDFETSNTGSFFNWIKRGV